VAIARFERETKYFSMPKSDMSLGATGAIASLFFKRYRENS
jgi:hypothetical protein